MHDLKTSNDGNEHGIAIGSRKLKMADVEKLRANKGKASGEDEEKQELMGKEKKEKMPAKETKVERTCLRNLAGTVFGVLVRLLIGLRIRV